MCAHVRVGMCAHVRVGVYAWARMTVLLNLECPLGGQYGFPGLTPDFLIQQVWVGPKNLNF